MSNTNPWWVKEPAIAEPALPPFRAVAYYRHSARDRQENSVAIQQELVQKWAKENGVDIIHEFADRGKSGLTRESIILAILERETRGLPFTVGSDGFDQSLPIRNSFQTLAIGGNA